MQGAQKTQTDFKNAEIFSFIFRIGKCLEPDKRVKSFLDAENEKIKMRCGLSNSGMIAQGNKALDKVRALT